MPSHLVGLFLPIFLYEVLGNYAIGAFLFYLLGHLLYGILLPFGARFLSTSVFRIALVVATFFNALFFGALLALSMAHGTSLQVSFLIAVMIVFLVLFRLNF